MSKLKAMQSLSLAAVRQLEYANFLQFVSDTNQVERTAVNRRMMSVFFWCFLAPALVTAVLIAGVNQHLIPPAAKGYSGWIVLVFPILYSIYFLSSQVLVGVPSAFRKGGVALSLGQALKEGEWRSRVCDRMEEELPYSEDSWYWILESFEADLERQQFRNRYLTALAAAVFFLMMQGIDSITSDPASKGPYVSGAEWVGLGLFLLLLYLSGSQTYQLLRRYVTCVRLMIESGAGADAQS